MNSPSTTDAYLLAEKKTFVKEIIRIGPSQAKYEDILMQSTNQQLKYLLKNIHYVAEYTASKSIPENIVLSDN